jgi:type VI secretion system protein ImpK
MSTPGSEPSERRESKSRPGNLALLYQGVFTGIVRLQAGRQRLSDPVTFRRRIKGALQDAHKEARAAGYSAREVRDAESAVVAFLDEVVLSLQHSARDEWVNKPLSVELYGDANAGEVFFDRLDEVRGQTDSQHVADMLEVYLLCLLLGFEGRYSGSLLSEAQLTAERLRARIEQIRGANYRLSPKLSFAEGPAAPARVAPTGRARRWWALAALPGAIVLFWCFYFTLQWRVNDFVTLLSNR